MSKLARTLLPFALVAAAGAAHAIPIIAVDADPGLAGIQAARTVTFGDTFSVLVTVQAGTPADEGAFDVIWFDLFQDALFSAAVTTPVGAATAGDLVAAAPLLALDLFTFDIPAVGDALGFGGTSGSAVGLTSLGAPFALPDTGAVSVALFTFTAAALGTSVLAPTGDLINDGFLLSVSLDPGGLSVFVPSVNLGAVIDVIGRVEVPEPGSVALVAVGLMLLVVVRRRRQGR